MSRFDHIILVVLSYIFLSAALIGSLDYLNETIGEPTPSVLGENVYEATSRVDDVSAIQNELEEEDVAIDAIADDIGRYKILKGTSLDPEGAEASQGFSLAWPVEGGMGIVTQCFDGAHNGIDIADPTYPEILAGEKGTVILAGCYGTCPSEGVYSGGSGLARTVMVEHDNGLISVYGHLHEIYVQEGDEVGRGQIIAKMGQTGEVRGGVHLHLSLLLNTHWDLLDPSKYLEEMVCIDGLPDPEAFYGEYVGNSDQITNPTIETQSSE